MVLYHLASTYQLIMGIVHKLAYHPDDEAVLVMPDYMPRTYPQYEELKSYGFFNEIVLFPRNERQYRKDTTNEELAQRMAELYNSLIKYDITSFSEIYIAATHHLFTIHVLESGVRFSFFEEACGQLSRYEEEFKDMIRNMHPVQYAYIEHFDLIDLNYDTVKYKYCNLNVQKEGFYDEKAVHFDVLKELEAFPDELRIKIMNFFRVPMNLDIVDNTVVLLSQHLANLKLTSFEGQALLYQLMFDYFLKDYQVKIKPHPEDIMYYETLFPSHTVIKETFPSEFLPFIFSKKPAAMATVFSTGLRAVAGVIDTILMFNVELSKTFQSTHKYYLALKHMEIFNRNATKPCYGFGINKAQLENLAHFGDLKWKEFSVDTTMPLDEIPLDSIVIIDRAIEPWKDFFEGVHQFLCRANEDTVVIFINSNEDYFFYNIDSDVFQYVYPATLQKSILTVDRDEDEFYDLPGEEVVYLFTKNKDALQTATTLKYSKELPYTGIDITVEPLDEQQIKIKLLEAKLAAAEKRLLFYIQATREE